MLFRSTAQLDEIASRPGMRAVAGFPDLHPGRYGPVGCAALADRLYPLLVGNDIGCGMSLFALDLAARKLRPDKAAERLRALEGSWDGPAAERLDRAGLPPSLHPLALGTIGGGNHFCEVQIVDDLAAPIVGIEAGSLVLLVHSGSRGLGTEVFATIADRNEGLALGTAEADAYLAAHDAAVRWASLNRSVIAERAAEALRTDLEVVADAPHNLIEVEGNLALHRKGAAKADGGLVPLAGSRDAPSFLLRPLSHAPSEALRSLAHGAGRKYDRSSMHGRVGRTRSEREALARNASGGRVVCEDRALLIEEAPSAYKAVERVLSDLVEAGLAEPVATLRPLVTFKRASDEPPDRKRARPDRERVRSDRTKGVRRGRGR